MLSREIALISLTPMVREKIKLISGIRFHAKINSYMLPIPLKIFVDLYKGYNTTHIYLSQTVDRPVKVNCEKEMLLQKKDTIVTYYGNTRHVAFQKDYVYITIEAEKEATIYLTCCFGKESVKKKSDEKTQKSEHKPRVSRFNQIDQIIREIISSTSEYQQVTAEAAEIKRKRKERSLQLSGYSDILERNRTMSPKSLVGCLSPISSTRKTEEMNKILQVKSERDKYENDTCMRKFLMNHRWEINKNYVFWSIKLSKKDELVQKKRQEIHDKNEGMKKWVAFFIGRKIGKILHQKYMVF